MSRPGIEAHWKSYTNSHEGKLRRLVITRLMVKGAKIVCVVLALVLFLVTLTRPSPEYYENKFNTGEIRRLYPID